MSLVAAVAVTVGDARSMRRCSSFEQLISSLAAIRELNDGSTPAKRLVRQASSFFSVVVSTDLTILNDSRSA